ncbi:hypothetical protein Kfla_3024 [Kribbella flavida DSM 17836]|uniref:VOC domain-containing protein n=1 Tax=Kribbella flavida (strain DSM 17836 / JCM 10339 / NBRC 14399) TaxID=479435 RepID=D2Q1U9_KRIFD|nr:VOC family protein [Kribbella flavida]ADB32088.1 hypothetical protein Kfla_3024 [Kribbella flavida DSM 17836]
MSGQVVVRPLRFSADIEAMRKFYELLGLRSRVESERGGWIDMVAGSGMVALHDAATSATGGRPGETRLCFEADEIDGLKQRLLDAGHTDATIIDEAFGRALTVSGPGGAPVWIDERSRDLYGYKLHDADPDRRWSVTPYLTGAEPKDWQRFLEQLATGARLHYGPGDFDVRVELTATEDPAAVSDRLSAAGFEPSRDEEGLTVVDPDGRPLRIRC